MDFVAGKRTQRKTLRSTAVTLQVEKDVEVMMMSIPIHRLFYLSYHGYLVSLANKTTPFLNQYAFKNIHAAPLRNVKTTFPALLDLKALC